MKILLLLPLLLWPCFSGQGPTVTDENPALTFPSFKWFKDRKLIENAVSVTVSPAPAMTTFNKNFEKEKRINASAGERDPNADSIDGRSAELERIVQQSREPQPVAGFTYQVKLQNSGLKPTQIIFWEYQFKETANPANVTRRQFLCSVRMKPDQGKDLQVFTLGGPSEVINIKSLAKGSGDQFQEAVFINRVEYSDGSFWQRKGWNVDDLKLTSKARLETRNMPTCRSL